MASRPDTGRDPLQASPSGEPERRVIKTSETIAHAIVRDIGMRELQTGDHLAREADMLDTYRVSRPSFREALRLLESHGLITLKPGPGGGPVVGAADARYLARTISLYFHLAGMTYTHVFDAQEILEQACARLAAASPDRAVVMSRHVDAMPPSAGPRYHSATVEFHADVYRLAGNGVLTLLAHAVTSIVTTHIVSTMDPVELHDGILDEHRLLAGAIAAGEHDRAAQLMAGHFRRQHQYYRERWPARFDQFIEWR